MINAIISKNNQTELVIQDLLNQLIYLLENVIKIKWWKLISKISVVSFKTKTENQR